MQTDTNDVPKNGKPAVRKPVRSVFAAPAPGQPCPVPDGVAFFEARYLGSHVPLTCPAEDGVIRSRFPIAEFEVRRMHSLWGDGKYRVHWFDSAGRVRGSNRFGVVLGARPAEIEAGAPAASTPTHRDAAPPPAIPEALRTAQMIQELGSSHAAAVIGGATQMLQIALTRGRENDGVAQALSAMAQAIATMGQAIQALPATIAAAMSRDDDGEEDDEDDDNGRETGAQSAETFPGGNP